MSNKKLIIDFTTSSKLPWTVINDNVMGGLSEGHAELQSQALRFYGLISTDNNGGFTSVYSAPIKLSKSIEAISITIKGDGNRYQLRMRSSVMGRELVYKVDFLTKTNQTETYRFLFSDFKASFRGSIVVDAPDLKANTVTKVGFLIGPNQKKMFLLSVYKIEFH